MKQTVESVTLNWRPFKQSGLKASLFLLVCLLISVMLSGCQQSTPEPESRLAASTIKMVKPLYDELHDSLENLENQVDAFCQSPHKQTPDSPSLNVMKESWMQAMFRWQQASVVNFGPVTLDSMAWKFQFWPDKKNLIKQRVEQSLRTGITEDTSWTAAALGNASVVARGLGAAEYLLFDPEAGERISEPARCQYLLAVAGDMKRNSARLRKSWQGGENRYPAELQLLASQVFEGDESDSYFQVSALIVSSLHETMGTASRKLAMPLGKGKPVGNPYLAESWRSRVSLMNLQNNLIAAQKLYQGGENKEAYGLDDRLASTGEEGRLTAEEIHVAFEEVRKAMPQEGVLVDEVADVNGREVLLDLSVRIDRLTRLFAGKVPDRLGIPLGFNSNDGD